MTEAANSGHRLAIDPSEQIIGARGSQLGLGLQQRSSCAASGVSATAFPDVQEFHGKFGRHFWV